MLHDARILLHLTQRSQNTNLMIHITYIHNKSDPTFFLLLFFLPSHTKRQLFIHWIIIILLSILIVWSIKGENCKNLQGPYREFDKITCCDLTIFKKQARLWACGRGDVSTPSFGSHLSPISTKGGRLYPPYTVVHTKFWKPQVRLLCQS